MRAQGGARVPRVALGVRGRLARRRLLAAGARELLAEELVPGHFGIYYQIDRPSKQDIEAKINAKFIEKTKGMEDWEILQQNFDKMR